MIFAPGNCLPALAPYQQRIMSGIHGRQQHDKLISPNTSNCIRFTHTVLHALSCLNQQHVSYIMT